MNPARVLISDDEAPLVRALARLFRRQGVESVEDFEGEVVALATSQHPDLILLDVNHKVDGIGLLKELKQNANTRDVPVVMMSGDDTGPERLAAQQAGAEEFLLKPFGGDDITRLITKIRIRRGE
jgi:CheY-like chemotaxis protein